MPKSCVVFGCHKHNYCTDKKRSFFELPKRHKSPERRDMWLAAINRVNADGSPWSPSKYSTVCSDHFVTGRPVGDKLHPDYVPSIFPHKAESQDTAEKPLKRLKRCKSSVQHCVKRLVSDGGADGGDQATDSVHSSSSNDQQATTSRPTRSTEEEDSPLPSKTQTDTVPNLQEQLNGEKNIIKQLNDYIAVQEKHNIAREDASYFTDKERRLLSVSSIEGVDSHCKFYTGLTWSVFQKTFSFLAPHVQAKTNESLSFVDQLVLTLARLRLDLSFELLAYLTRCAEAAVRCYFWKWIGVMHVKMDFLVRWPDPETISKTLPLEFKKKFPRLTSIVDCFELFIEMPENALAHQQTCSSHKNHATVKVLISYSPLGAVTFLSSAWSCGLSDVDLVRQSGFISPARHQPGDQILADPGFPLKDDFTALCGAQLVIPSFTKSKAQLSTKEVETSREESSIRAHVTQVLGLIKNRYTILQGTLPIHIKSRKGEADEADLTSIHRILTVCAVLVNLGPSIVFKG